ncbi:uncharacterized protein LOC9656108 isoform X1 [Selaginella moellendorffii]|uniref:uncharacterized protein LOC9656108 isoform X1 n=1 Tax=Selaginella moellendorffii TaxID=88036 RepID=UPI000D1CAD18|nr:uncharacterized protein LOC9656108 isoform X1 [Selaginella moellendorffii]|eukprot:XP_002977571.2 uncharacterized protein LOC9656108 isoform X1 [Selaginella moellendorffii]
MMATLGLWHSPVSSRILLQQGRRGCVKLWSRNFMAHARLIRASTVSHYSETFYADAGIDRATELRLDSKFISQAYADPKALAVPVQGNKNFVKCDQALFFSPDKLDSDKRIFLGLTIPDRLPVFAVDVKQSSSDWQTEGQWVDLRRYGPELRASHAGLLAYARGMVEWNSRNRFCGLCGSRMISHHAGHCLKCSLQSCQNSIYPRLDPAIIVLVSFGKYILLGRQKKWEQGRYSLLAGFVEVGETFEQAVVREVKEEANIDVNPSSIKYVANQPWPFPSSLMVGFVGEANGKFLEPKSQLTDDEVLAGVHDCDTLPKIAANSSELEDARWVHQDFLKAVLMNKSTCNFSVPGKHAIARLLMERWIESDTEDSWAGKDVQTTEIDEGKFKYVLIRLKDSSGNQKLVVRGNKELPFHTDILEAFQKEVAPLGLQVEAMGGGKMEHSPEQQVIHVFGVSQAFGPANHKLTSSILCQSFPLYKIFISSDDA